MKTCYCTVVDSSRLVLTMFLVGFTGIAVSGQNVCPASAERCPEQVDSKKDIPSLASPISHIGGVLSLLQQLHKD